MFKLQFGCHVVKTPQRLERYLIFLHREMPEKTHIAVQLLGDDGTIRETFLTRAQYDLAMRNPVVVVEDRRESENAERAVRMADFDRKIVKT